MKYQFESRIRYSEVDAEGELSWSSLLDYFQDCSVFHSEAVGIGIDYLAQHHLAWMLSSWQILKNRMPRFGERVEVQTWAYGLKSFYGFRNFSLNDSNGEPLAYANSIWILINTETGRPVRISADFVEAYGLEPQIEMECSDRKIVLTQEFIPQQEITIPDYFIDTNHHMNNGKYVLLAQEYLPQGFVPQEVRAEYKKAAKQKDIMRPELAIEDGKVTVQLVDKEGETYAVVVFLA